MATLSPEEFGAINRRRVEHWHPGFPEDGWTVADWSNAMVGEAGEVANEVKKIRRLQTPDLHSRKGGVQDSMSAALQRTLREVGDVYTYLDLLCQFLDLPNPVYCAQVKFNEISEREGIDVWMPDPDVDQPELPAAEPTEIEMCPSCAHPSGAHAGPFRGETQCVMGGCGCPRPQPWHAVKLTLRPTDACEHKRKLRRYHGDPWGCTDCGATLDVTEVVTVRVNESLGTMDRTGH